MPATDITIKDLYPLISKQGADKTMYIEFVKKGDGSLRKMTFQLSGYCKNDGNRLPIHRVLEDTSHGILTVWDMNKDTYRRLNLQAVKKLVIDQTDYNVKP